MIIAPFSILFFLSHYPDTMISIYASNASTLDERTLEVSTAGWTTTLVRWPMYSTSRVWDGMSSRLWLFGAAEGSSPDLADREGFG